MQFTKQKLKKCFENAVKHFYWFLKELNFICFMLIHIYRNFLWYALFASLIFNKTNVHPFDRIIAQMVNGASKCQFPVQRILMLALCMCIKPLNLMTLISNDSLFSPFFSFFLSLSHTFIACKNIFHFWTFEKYFHLI